MQAHTCPTQRPGTPPEALCPQEYPALRLQGGVAYKASLTPMNALWTPLDKTRKTSDRAADHSNMTLPFHQ